MLVSFATIIVTLVGFVAAKEKYIVCYYGTWATYRSGLGKFDVSNINPQLCTHLIYTFVGINTSGEVVSLDAYLDLPDNYGRDNFRNFNALKTVNPNLKTLLAVGGWNEGSAKYSTMAANPTLRKNFITSAVNMINNYGFDGFDIDWEYPNSRDSTNGNADINNFTELLKELREAFDKYGLILTAAVSPTKATASLSYDIPSISQYIDLINVMAYDMYGPWDSVTGHNAPLHKGEGFENVAKANVNSVDVALDYWLSQGCPPEKLVLGVPFYGHSFKLVNAADNSVRAPSSGLGIAGPFTVSNGMLGYNEFCNILKTESWEVRSDDEAKVPYAVKGTDWVSYDDVESIAEKAEYALSLDIAGVMVWSIETDDFNGICDGEKFPLLNSINRALGKSSVVSSTTTPTSTASTTTTVSTTKVSSTVSTTKGSSTVSSTTTSTTVSSTKGSSTVSSTTGSSSTPSSKVICSEPGFIPNPSDCSSFYMCTWGNTGLEPTLQKCPKSLYWDQKNLYCNYPYFVKCNI